jgi:nifR3 family TIM-barrel protein
MTSFWNNLERPFSVLAPMEEVTDAAFRRIVAKYGKPDVLFTEFTSADGLCSVGRDRVAERLIFSQEERPIVAQLWSSHPDHIFAAAKIAAEMGFDGIDINMGCPDRAVCAAGAGAALINNKPLAAEIVHAAQEGGRLPVSVKTRSGFDEREVEAWIGFLLDLDLAAVTLHARTKKEKSLVPAAWSDVQQAVAIRNARDQCHTLIIGNGDVKDMHDAEIKCEETGADGVMIGRAVIGNPWLFDQNKQEVSLQEKLAVMCEHAELFEEIFTGKKNFAEVKKHLHAYAHGFDGAKQLRMELMHTTCAVEVQKIVETFTKKHEIFS